MRSLQRFHDTCNNTILNYKERTRALGALPPDATELVDEKYSCVYWMQCLQFAKFALNSAPFSRRKLKICHFKKGTEICNYSYSNTILAVKLNRLRLIVCLEESLYVHNIRDMKVLHTIRDTPPNPQGLCALSVSNDNCFLAYPGSSQVLVSRMGAMVQSLNRE